MSGGRGGRRRDLGGRGVEGSRRGARVGDALLMGVAVVLGVWFVGVKSQCFDVEWSTATRRLD